MSFQSISDALDAEFIENIEEESFSGELVPVEYDSDNAEQEDFDLVRNSLRDLLTKSNAVLDQISDISKDSESPRAYEVTANLIKTISDVSKDLMELHNKRVKKTKDQSATTINNNTLYVGTTAELQKLLADARKT